MKTIHTNEQLSKIRNWALPNQKISHEEFLKAIKEAEEGPFMTVEEAMLDFEKWMKSREKK